MIGPLLGHISRYISHYLWSFQETHFKISYFCVLDQFSFCFQIICIALKTETDFDKSIHDFEEFAREVFNGSNENEKMKLHKKLEELMTFKEHY